MLPQSLSGHFDKWNKTCLPLLIAFSSLSDINTTLKFLSLENEVLYCVTLSLRHHYDIGMRYHITMSLQCHYVVGLHRVFLLLSNVRVA